MKTKLIRAKQLEILILIYRFRFLTLYKLQELLDHKNHHRILVWLNDLIEKGLIGKIDSSKFPNVAAYYYLKTGGIKILRSKNDIYKPSLKKFYEESKRTTKFISHSLFIVDIYLKFKKLTKDGEVQFKTKIEMEKSDFLPKHLPDAYVSVQEKQKRRERCFLILFDEGVPNTVMNMKIKEYIEYSNEGEWEDNTGYPFPEILIICPTIGNKNKLQKSIVRMLEEEGSDNLSFYLTTKQSIQERGVGQEVWEKVI